MILTPGAGLHIVIRSKQTDQTPEGEDGLRTGRDSGLGSKDDKSVNVDGPDSSLRVACGRAFFMELLP